MVFSSYIFIFAFLPLVLLGFYLLPRLIAAPGRLRRAQNLLLIAASLVFTAILMSAICCSSPRPSW